MKTYYYIVTYSYPFGQGVNTLQFNNIEGLIYWLEDNKQIKDILINTVIQWKK